MVAFIKKNPYLPLVGIGAGVVLALIMARKMDLIPGINDVAYGAGSAAVSAVDSVLSGTVETAGLMVGIPKTNMTQCQKDIAAGRMWDASFSCPAKDFLGAAWDRI